MVGLLKSALIAYTVCFNFCCWHGVECGGLVCLIVPLGSSLFSRPWISFYPFSELYFRLVSSRKLDGKNRGKLISITFDIFNVWLTMGFFFLQDKHQLVCYNIIYKFHYFNLSKPTGFDTSDDTDVAIEELYQVNTSERHVKLSVPVIKNR